MKFSKAIILLSVVSLLTDISSEMLYPVLPLYLSQIGFSVFWIGILEGLAQFIVGLSGGYFAEWSDRIRKRKPFIVTGYFLSTVSKPLMVLMSQIPWVFLMRLTERTGKGIRTGARDALLLDEAPEGKEGSVFGFHRAMDTLGAAIGPAIALMYLLNHSGDYKSLFLYSFFPGLVAVLFLIFIKEKKQSKIEYKQRLGFFSYLKYWKKADRNYRMIVAGFLLFTLFNSADAFLFLKAKRAGINDQNIILAYIGYNLVYALFSLPAGMIADRIGMKKTMIFGLIVFAVTYAGFAYSQSSFYLYVFFALYGIYAASTEGISKAWIGQNCKPEDRGVAQGFFKSTTSILAIVSGAITGLAWMFISPEFALILGVVGALSASIFFIFLTFDRQK